MKDLNALCDKLKDLTWYNNHTQARVEIAEHFDLHKYIRICKDIESICNVEGHTPSDICSYRYKKDKELLQAIKQYHGEEVYNKIYNSL